MSYTWIPICCKLAGWRHSGTTEEKIKKYYILYIDTVSSVKSMLMWLKAALINNHIQLWLKHACDSVSC